MGSDKTHALFRLGRELLYRELPLIGRKLTIISMLDVELALRELIAPWVPARDAPWDGCDVQAGLAKYGLLDRSFAAPSGLLDDPEAWVGVRALRETGFATEREPDPDPEEEAMIAEIEAECLVDLAAELDANTCVLKLFLQDDLTWDQHSAHLRSVPGLFDGAELPLMPSYFPREFTVVDACVTNARGIWANKHFYL